MITVLVVSDRPEQIAAVAGRRPSLEVLHARDVEETLERLARNRRIDAVLLLIGGDRASEIVATVLEEDPAAPPFFAPALAQGTPSVRIVAGATPEELLEAVARELSG